MKSQYKTPVAGFSLIDLLLIIAAVVAMAAVILPSLARPRRSCCRISCTNNLKQLGLAYRQWAIDNNDKFPDQVSTTDGGAKESIEAGAIYTSFLVMSNELNTPKLLICPQESRPNRVTATTFVSYEPTNWTGRPFTNNNNVSYFVGLDAEERQPNTILTGDDNFTVAGAKPAQGILTLWTNSPVAWTRDRHVNQGNFALADGSVLGLTTPMLRKALVKTGMATNRLAMP